MTFFVLELFFLIALIFCSGFFSSAETALFSLNPIQIHRIRKKSNIIADQLNEMLARPSKLLSTVLIGNIVVNVAASVVGLDLVMCLFPRHAEIISIGAMTVILLMFGEITPKRYAMLKPEILAVYYVPWLKIVMKLLAPLTALLDLTAVACRKALVPYGRILDEDEFRTLIAMSGEEGVLSADEREIVDGIIRLENIRASDVMTPRVDIVGLDMEDGADSFDPIIRKTVYRYLVVYRDHLEKVEGLLDVRRYLMHPEQGLAAALMPPSFVPESARLNTILRDFQKESRSVSLVVDEYGGVAGLLSIGDVLEEVVDVGDDDEEVDVRETDRDKWIVDGSVSVEEINSKLGVGIEAEEADRIAGWVLEKLHRMPRIGETVEQENVRVTVLEIRKKRVTKVSVEVTDKAGEKD